MNIEKPIGAGKSGAPLTRADVERLQSNVEHAAQLDLCSRNLQQIDLSYMDLQGADLRGADLQGANLRGTNLKGANLQAANLSGADLDGANLSHARLGGTAGRVKLDGARLSYATLRDLDLRGFNLTDLDLRNADLNGTDLRGASLRGADLQGADLSTARLNGPELSGAILHRSAFAGSAGEHVDREKGARKRIAPAQAILIEEHSSPLREQESEPLGDEREAYLFGSQTLLAGANPAKIRELFPQGFTFLQARQHFDAWLVRTEGDYNEQALRAMWIGFAYRICDLYYQNEAEA